MSGHSFASGNGGEGRGISVAEYLSETLRKPVDRDFLEMMEKMKPGARVRREGVTKGKGEK